jgi:hypothetical protein
MATRQRDARLSSALWHAGGEPAVFAHNLPQRSFSTVHFQVTPSKKSLRLAHRSRVWKAPLHDFKKPGVPADAGQLRAVGRTKLPEPT